MPEEMEDWELLAVLIGKGTKAKNVESLSRELLYKLSGIGGLLTTNPLSLQEISGLGRAKAATLLAVREISFRLKINHTPFHPQVSFEETLQHLMESLYLRTLQSNRECFYLITFSHAKKHLHTRLVARGSLNEVGVHTRDIVKLMLDDGASYTIIAHNHPYDHCRPSAEDLFLFSKLKEVLFPLEIGLLDQWIFGIDGIHSCIQNQKINANAQGNQPQFQNYTHPS